MSDKGERARPGAPVLTWRCVPFDSLSPRELQAIHRARQRVFTVEQSCAFLDADEFDEVAQHLIACAAGEVEPLAYARLLPPGAKSTDASIGRVLTGAAARGRGLGRELLERALALAEAIWPHAGLRISAQAHLEAFYASFGFVAVGAPYLEDGIDHIEMVRVAGSASADLGG